MEITKGFSVIIEQFHCSKHTHKVKYFYLIYENSFIVSSAVVPYTLYIEVHYLYFIAKQ